MVILKEPVIVFDVDDTLVIFHDAENHPDAIEVQCPLGGALRLVPHKKHIEYLKKVKAEGFTVVVWSWAGAQWASNAVDALQLNTYVDVISAKPEAYVDNMDASEWMKRIYIPNED